MTDKLPPNLLALFAPRPQLRYLPPSDHAPEERKTARIGGISQYLPALHAKVAKAKAAEEGEPVDADDPEPETKATLSKLEERNNRVLDEVEHQKWLEEEGYKTLYNPKKDDNIRGDPYRTLFVSRLDYKTEAADLEKEFRRFGNVERVKIVVANGKSDSAHPNRKSRKNQPRGYAFVLYETEEDLKAAVASARYMTVRGRPVVVDFERGRTQKDWKPRRFGGGKGGRHYTKEVARPSNYGGFGPGGYDGGRGGFRGGGFRGGFDRGGRGGRGGFRGGFDGGRGGYGGGRGGIGYDNVPRGPGGGGYRGGGGGGYDGGGYGGRGGGGGGGYDDRSRGNANMEPLPPRDGARGRYQDRDGDRDGGSGYKRPYEGGGYDESRSRRRY